MQHATFVLTVLEVKYMSSSQETTIASVTDMMGRPHSAVAVSLKHERFQYRRSWTTLGMLPRNRNGNPRHTSQAQDQRERSPHPELPAFKHVKQRAHNKPIACQCTSLNVIELLQ